MQEFEDYGAGIIDAIDTVRKTKDEKRRPIIFIGHSFGGTLIKKVRHYPKPVLLLSSAFSPS